MQGEMGTTQYTLEDRLIDKMDELKDSTREVTENIQKLMYYVIVIGALNGTVTVGKIVDQVADKGQDQIVGEVMRHERSKNQTFNPREDKPRIGQPVD